MSRLAVRFPLSSPHKVIPVSPNCPNATSITVSQDLEDSVDSDSFTFCCDIRDYCAYDDYDSIGNENTVKNEA